MKHLLLLIVALLTSLMPAWASAAERKPNVILILADDLGTGNVSCYGSDLFKTPNIDALANSGIRFERCFSSPICGPSRAALLTGRYGFRTGMTGNPTGAFVKPDTEFMLPRLFKSVGYITAEAGKWSQLILEPGDFGFDEYLRFKASGKYWNTQDGAKTYTLNGKSVDLKDGDYLPDLMHNFVVDFITRNHDKPFFVYYPMSHVHSDILPTPDSAKDSTDLYMDNIKYMDKLVGKLMAELDRQKLRENTLVIFVGDNGTVGGQQVRSTIKGKTISGAKGTMLEGGSLVPMMASLPGVIAPGQVSNNLMDFTDYFPTLAELIDAKMPENVIIDGKSFASTLRGNPAPVRDHIFVLLGRNWYVRSDLWKLNHLGELFDMSKAPFEETLVPADSTNPEAQAARKTLQATLDKLAPEKGIVDQGDGTGKHENKKKKAK